MLAANDYQKDINTMNPLGMKGALATAFAQMISALWSGTYRSFAPTKIKVLVVVWLQWHSSLYSAITCGYFHATQITL